MSTDRQQPDGRSGPAVSSIPLVDDNAYATGVRGDGAGEPSFGTLVRDLTTHLSTLVRAEVELAKQEVTAEAKKALKGGVFFIVALTVLLFSLFFFFIAIASVLIDVFGMYSSAAYGIVFGLMLVVAGLFGFLGYRKVTKLRAPQRTIDSAKGTMAALSRGKDKDGATAAAQIEAPRPS